MSHVDYVIVHEIFVFDTLDAIETASDFGNQIQLISITMNGQMLGGIQLSFLVLFPLVMPPLGCTWPACAMGSLVRSR